MVAVGVTDGQLAAIMRACEPLEQQVTDTVGLFARAGWADGNVERRRRGVKRKRR